MTETKRENGFDIDLLLHPARAFESPAEIVNDRDLTTNEKRAILASWASDACAVDSAPELRSMPNGKPVTFDDIMDALRALDGAAAEKPHYRKLVTRARRLRSVFRPRDSGDIFLS